MKRLLAAPALALIVAAPAAASLPIIKSGTSVGEGRPLKAYATITPTVHLFGDSITAKLAVVADTKWVDPSRLKVTTDFTPYQPINAPTVLQLRIGRFAQITWTWTLRCITSPCVPRAPPSDVYRFWQFPPAHIAYLNVNRKPAYGINASWPPIEVLSQVSPGVVEILARTHALNWQLGVSPVATPTYRISPTLLLWLSIAAASLFVLAGAWFASRWYLVMRPRPVAAPPLDPATTLERAIAVLRYAHETGDETLQRKAFERVAAELGVQRADELTRVARELAWSQRTPEHDEVEEFAEQARVPRKDES